MEGVAVNWRGKRVLLTGHTGFKGSWLSLWLQNQGADLCGIALEPPTPVNMFCDAQVAGGMRSLIGDTRDAALLRQTFSEFRPEIIFHLAAQPSVRESYADPLRTYSTNVMGTVNVLDAARHIDCLRAIIVITSDKCYLNHEWEWPYRETDPLGGYDPYSNSKACAELVVSAYRDSFFNRKEYARHGVAIASVRAGNVIGGGDWEASRLVPDTIRGFMSGQPVRIRNPAGDPALAACSRAPAGLSHAGGIYVRARRRRRRSLELRSGPIRLPAGGVGSSRNGKSVGRRCSLGE